MQSIVKLFNRDLSRLRKEISAFSIEKNIWKKYPGIENSAGNLCLHLLGNLNHFVGAIIGKSGYVRNRQAEFDDKNVAKLELIQRIDDVQKMVRDVLTSSDENKMKEVFPQTIFDENMSHQDFLIHLLTHLNYHLGQINYLRRFLEKETSME